MNQKNHYRKCLALFPVEFNVISSGQDLPDDNNNKK